MEVENGDLEDALDGPSFTIGSPSEPVPQAALRDRYLSMDKGVEFDEVDYQSKKLVHPALTLQ